MRERNKQHGSSYPVSGLRRGISLLVLAVFLGPFKMISFDATLSYFNYQKRRMAIAKDKTPKYAEALLVYATTAESLKSITERMGYPYISVRTYLRTHYPELIDIHKLQLSEEKASPRPSSVTKYAKAVALLTKLKAEQCNSIKVIAEQLDLNYHSLRKHIYDHHRELINLDPAENIPCRHERVIEKYAEAVSRLSRIKTSPENHIRYAADKLGLEYHALRKYIYTYHPELTQTKKTL